ncbi:MAG: hypothetical protein ACXWQR_13520 [Ktedonobacterales bacterium]
MSQQYVSTCGQIVNLKMIPHPSLAAADTLSCGYRYALLLATAGITQHVDGAITAP